MKTIRFLGSMVCTFVGLLMLAPVLDQLYTYLAFGDTCVASYLREYALLVDEIWHALTKMIF